MVPLLETPLLWVLAALAAYAVTYFVYSKWVDEKIWESRADRVTPAHMYMDGVEFFPVSRSVLYGFQFKSIAAVGPILGPFVAIQYGWLPALLWIILGNMFIGWVQDYSSIMLTVRNEGRSMGPLVYQYVGEKPRMILLGYLLFYILILSAAATYMISLYWSIFPGSFLASLLLILFGVAIGQMLYRYQINIYAVTVFAVVAVIVSVLVGVYVKWPPQDFLGPSTQAFWMLVLAAILTIASLAPMPVFIIPVNFVASIPAIAGIIIIIVGAILSPVTGVTVKQEAFKTFFSPAVGPLFPILFVSIACGAISGWHSIVSTSTTGKQLDVETDARPVGAGAMLTEGLLALASLAAYMVLSMDEIAKLKEGPASFVAGATRIASSYLGGEAAAAFWASFFSLFLVIYAVTAQTLVARYWRVVSGEIFSKGFLSILGNKYVATLTGVLIPILFALSGSWINLWIYFGGSNQLMAGLALMLVAIAVARMKKPSIYALAPAVFMIVVTLSALAWTTYTYIDRVAKYISTGNVNVLYARPPLSNYPTLAFAMNVVFVVVGFMLIALGMIMSYYLFRAYLAKPEQVATAPAKAGKPA